MTALAPRSSADSVTDMTEYVLPQHANALGGVFGGQIMAWVDLCGAICASRHSTHQAVTAFVDDLKFQAPVLVGEVVRLHAEVTATFRTSMEIEVTVEGEDLKTRRRWPCVQALLTFVAVDEKGKPTPVPPLLLDSPKARDAQRMGEERRRLRIAGPSGR
jgi:acyl-CoA hydrolase